MIKNLIKKLLKVFGFQISRLPKQSTGSLFLQRVISRAAKDNFLKLIARDPLNANLHFQYAIAASKTGNPYLAYAELKTAECLGLDQTQVEKYSAAFKTAIPDQKYMMHNQYYRLATLASEITSRGGKSDITVLDVGGGHGELASFIPDAYYCLAEPAVNGISGTNLPFQDHSFDYVISCHVLEHIPVNERRKFLDQLLSKSKYGVILLNPFYVEGTHVEERLKLFIDITDAQWAKEHLACTLPRIEDIRDYAAERGLQVVVKPNGTIATTIAMVFVQYFASKSGLSENLKKIDAFFNQNYTDILDSDKYPTAYLVYLGWPKVE